jgi:protein-arginine kinase
VVLVNFEDHLRFISLPDKSNKNDDINKGIGRMFKLISTFEKLGYAYDSYLGNLTVSPAVLGSALKLSVRLSLTANDTKLDKDLDFKLKQDS